MIFRKYDILNIALSTVKIHFQPMSHFTQKALLRIFKLKNLHFPLKLKFNIVASGKMNDLKLLETAN